MNKMPHHVRVDIVNDYDNFLTMVLGEESAWLLIPRALVQTVHPSPIAFLNARR